MLIDQVRETINAHKLISSGDHIVLGLSGGPDSVCLFDVLRRLSTELDLTIHPVHVNHQFRPGDAERDQEFVEGICAKAGLSCHSFVVDVNALAREQGMTSEEAGRKARYDAFTQVAREARGGQEVAGQSETEKKQEGPLLPGVPPGVRIAVAQNANDQAETILHRILRGTGTDGLAGIAYQRYEGEIPVIRPLLDVSRSEIENYCREQGLETVTDHTNQQPIYTRNRIRLQLLPQLTEYNSNIIASLTRLGRIAADDKDFLWQETERAWVEVIDLAWDGTEADQTEADRAEADRIEADREGLANLHPAIRHRIVLKAFHKIGLESDISEERLQAADAIISRKQAPKTVEFPRGYRLTVARGKVCFSRSGRIG